MAAPGNPFKPGSRLWKNYNRIVGGEQQYLNQHAPASVAAQANQGLHASSDTNGLAQLWIQAGGDPRLANTMAAIAMAESSGRVNAQGSNTNGTVDRGLWQINSSHTQFDGQRLLSDPLYNAQAAVSIEKSQGLTAWTTFTSGAYKRFLGAASKVTPNYGGPNGGVVRPGGNASAGPTVQDKLKEYVSLRDAPRTAPPGTKNPFAWWAASFTGKWDNLTGTGDGSL